MPCSPTPSRSGTSTSSWRKRTKADFENYRKRMAAEVQAAAARGKAELAAGADRRDRQPRAGAGRRPASSPAPRRLAAEAAGGGLLPHLPRAAARRSSGPASSRSTRPARGSTPTWHEALQKLPVDGAEPGTVVEVMQKGYRLGEQLIRPARVVVSE